MTPLESSRVHGQNVLASAASRREAARPGARAVHLARTVRHAIAEAIAHLAKGLRSFTALRLDEQALIAVVREPGFEPHLLANLSYAHEHQIMAGLMNRETATDRRVTALIAMQSMPVQAASPLLHALLKDPVDDVRLLAYGMLGKCEKRVMRQISAERLKLTQPLSSDECHQVDKTLAELYWELIYARLVEGDIYAHALEEANTHTEHALRHCPSDGALWRLRGRLALEARRFDEAEVMLSKAVDCGFPRMRVLPYLAEIAYLRSDYAAVRRYLNDLPPALTHVLAPVAAYWNT